MPDGNHDRHVIDASDPMALRRRFVAGGSQEMADW
jgi:hypothetical protein